MARRSDLFHSSATGIRIELVRSLATTTYVLRGMTCLVLTFGEWYLRCAKGQGSLLPWKILFLLPQKSTPKIQFETTHPTLLLTIIIPAPRSTTFHDKVFPINYADPKRPITFILPLLKNISVGISPNLGLAPELWGLTISVMILHMISYFSKDTQDLTKKLLF